VKFVLYKEEELLESATSENFSEVQQEGNRFVVDIIRSATKSIVLIDNYVDESVLTLLSKRNNSVEVTIYTAVITPQLKLDLNRHNAQYPPVKVKSFTKSHDRFLILDHTTVYHIGASLKDLGKKWFAFSKIELDALEMMREDFTNFKRISRTFLVTFD